jgi:elongation factor 1-alpha
MEKLKEKHNILFLGNPDSGIETTKGHLIYKLGGIDRKIITRIEKEVRRSKSQINKYSLLMQMAISERER